MNTTSLSKYMMIILPIIKKHAPDAKVTVFGSRARGDNDEGADIDIALDEGKTMDRAKISAILGDLEDSQLPILFDVVDFRSINERMQKEILKEGIVWQK